MKEYKAFEAFMTNDGPIILRPRVVVTLKGAYNNIMAQDNGKAYYFFYKDIKTIFGSTSVGSTGSSP